MRQQIRERVDAHPVAAFFAFAYAISWVAWLGPLLELTEPIRTLGFILRGTARSSQPSSSRGSGAIRFRRGHARSSTDASRRGGTSLR